jgi:hypothetical protein
MKQNDWRDHDDSGSDPPDKAGWSPEMSLGDPDAWRGDAHASLDDFWRGDEHAEEWPEWNAGPEYRMWKRIQRNEKPD